MFAACGVCLWWIFSPSASSVQAEAGRTGFNASLPDPEGDGIVGDKKSAYEQEHRRLRQQEKMRTLEEHAFALADGDYADAGSASEAARAFPAPAGAVRSGSYGTSRARSSFDASAAACRDLGTTLGSFYESPPQDEEKERLRAEVETLRSSLAAQPTVSRSAYEEQVALLEKSYELASKYLPGHETEAAPTGRHGTAHVVPVGTVERSIVSALPQPQHDIVAAADAAEPCRRTFHTAVGAAPAATRNTIRACVACDQTLTDGQDVRLRLQEQMRVGSLMLPRNTLLIGTGRLAGERLSISITSIEYGGTILPVALTVYDSDGQHGLHVPSSMEISAAKDAAATLGQGLGTTVSITNRSAGDQLLSELGQGAIQGVTQYVSRKVRTVKVHLKEGYGVLLRPTDN